MKLSLLLGIWSAKTIVMCNALKSLQEWFQEWYKAWGKLKDPIKYLFFKNNDIVLTLFRFSLNFKILANISSSFSTWLPYWQAHKFVSDILDYGLGSYNWWFGEYCCRKVHTSGPDKSQESIYCAYLVQL